MNEFKKYTRKGFSLIRDYVLDEDLSEISVSPEDTPETDMGVIAVNPDNSKDKWYINRRYFEDNLMLYNDPAPLPEENKGCGGACNCQSSEPQTELDMYQKISLMDLAMRTESAGTMGISLYKKMLTEIEGVVDTQKD